MSPSTIKLTGGVEITIEPKREVHSILFQIKPAGFPKAFPIMVSAVEAGRVAVELAKACAIVYPRPDADDFLRGIVNYLTNKG